MLCCRLLYAIVLTSVVYDACVCVCVGVCVRVCVRVCVCVVIVHWHCSAQLSMFNTEKRCRNKIIIIIIITFSPDIYETDDGFGRIQSQRHTTS